jgi:hyperosmotically inducible protein
MRGNKNDVSRRTLFLVAAAIAVLGIPLGAVSKAAPGATSQGLEENQLRLAKQVRHELVMLPFYSVFDNLQFSLEGTDTVVLSGEVTRPVLKSGAENVVRRVEGVSKVINKIEVLPLSPFDNGIRRAAYRAIFSQSGMYRYALQPIPSIHIVVKNGNVTLVGVVGSTMDKTLAGIAANGVPNVFSVKNDLMVEGRS